MAKFTRRTYQGRAARGATVGSRGYGLRASIVAWVDGPVEVKVVRGDGRTPSFEKIAEASFDSIDEAVAWAEAQVA